MGEANIRYNRNVNAPINPPTIINTQPAFDEFVRSLAQQSIIAVDTESNSLYVYQEQVCLLQFTDANGDTIVDPFADIDISALGDVFANPDIEIIFHAAEYDLICLERDFGFAFENIFDTMIAARILGRKKVGLGSLLEEEFDVHLAKNKQRANWGIRPIPRDMLHYAQMDTHYLIELRNRLKKALHASGRWSLAEEDFARARQVTQPVSPPRETMCWRVKGVRELSSSQRAVLQSLCEYRDDMAQRHNRPHFKILSDRTLLTIAEHQPENREQLALMPGMSRGQMRRYAKGLLRAVTNGLQRKAPKRPRHPRPDDAYLARLDALKTWRKQTAQAWEVESDVILPKNIMLALTTDAPTTHDALTHILRDVPYRLEHFGDDLLNVLEDARKTHT